MGVAGETRVSIVNEKMITIGELHNQNNYYEKI